MRTESKQSNKYKKRRSLVVFVLPSCKQQVAKNKAEQRISKDTESLGSPVSKESRDNTDSSLAILPNSEQEGNHYELK